MNAILDLAYSLFKEYGLSVTFLILYPITLIYVLTLRYKENHKTLQVINDLITSNNLLSKEVHRAIQTTNSIVAASIYALGDNKQEAKNILLCIDKIDKCQEDE